MKARSNYNLKTRFSRSSTSRWNRDSRMLTTVALSLLTVLGGVACGEVKKVHEMHDATLDMRDTTREMRDSTATMQDQTTQLGKQTGEMYDALRQGDSLAARRSSLQALLDAKEPSRKISEAAKYFMAFEYQLWSGLGQDTHVRREEAAMEAAREFMRDVQEFLRPEDSEPQPLASSIFGLLFVESSNRHSSLSALSAAMHMVNPKQTHGIHGQENLGEISMYSMIQAALRARREIDAGTKKAEDFPGYVKEILAHEHVARTLMELRYNYLGAMALARISKIRNGLATFAQMRFTSWTVDLSKNNVVEVNEFTRYLDGAMKAYEFMVSVGIQPRMNGRMAKIFENVRLAPSLKTSALSIQSAKVESRTAEQTTRAVAEAAFVEVLEKYRRSAGIMESLVSLPTKEDKPEGTPEVKSAFTF